MQIWSQGGKCHPTLLQNIVDAALESHCAAANGEASQQVAAAPYLHGQHILLAAAAAQEPSRARPAPPTESCGDDGEDNNNNNNNNEQQSNKW